MIRRVATSASGVLAIAGIIASAGALVAILGRSLQKYELAFSILSTVLGVLAGAFSSLLVKFGKGFKSAPRVFLSYSYTDKTIADEVVRALRANGARVWLDEERLKPGESIDEAIKEGIAQADALVVLVPERPKPYLTTELRMAHAKGLRVIPVVLTDADVPSDLQGLKYVDFRKERSRGVEELVRAVT